MAHNTPPGQDKDDVEPLIPRLRVIRDLCQETLREVRAQAGAVDAARADIAHLQADIDTAAFAMAAIQTTVDNILKNQTGGRASGFSISGEVVPATPPAVPPVDISKE